MDQLLSRKDIETLIPQLKGLSFPYWALVAGIIPEKKRVVKNRLTYLYTTEAAKKLKSTLRRRKPELFGQRGDRNGC